MNGWMDERELVGMPDSINHIGLSVKRERERERKWALIAMHHEEKEKKKKRTFCFPHTKHHRSNAKDPNLKNPKLCKNNGFFPPRWTIGCFHRNHMIPVSCAEYRINPSLPPLPSLLFYPPSSNTPRQEYLTPNYPHRLGPCRCVSPCISSVSSSHRAAGPAEPDRPFPPGSSLTLTAPTPYSSS